MFGHYLNDFLEESRQVSVYISTIGPCVLGSEPDLHNAFPDGLSGSFDDCIRIIRSEFASGMPGLAIRARSEAASRQRYDFYESVLPDLWQIQHGQVFLGKKLDLVSFESLLDDLNNSINLSDAQDTYIF